MSITPVACPSDESYDECYDIDFPGTRYDDTILLEDKVGHMYELGKLKNHPEVRVSALRKTPLDKKIEVHPCQQ